MSVRGRLGSHALVIGGSITGLATASALSARFGHVTVIDRDSLPPTEINRRAVPQGRHGHGLLASGLAALDGLFPGLEADLIAAGAISGDVIGDVRWFQYGCYKAKFQSGLRGLLMTRPLLEHTIRARVTPQPRIRIVDNCRVIGLRVNQPRRRIIGVRTQPDLDECLATADLVVDASGRASRSPT